jgi:hypothetical protein
MKEMMAIFEEVWKVEQKVEPKKKPNKTQLERTEFINVSERWLTK